MTTAGGRVSILSGSSILITGGTGSFGKAFVRHALDHLGVRRLVIFSRDELKQYEARHLFGDDQRLRWFIGDVRDRGRLTRAMHRIDYVVHAAALKQVDTAEYNPFEFVQTNITVGAVPNACIIYRITATNAGTSNITGVSVSDATPAFTVYRNVPVASTTVGTIVAPTNGTAGTITATVGTLTPSQSAVIIFAVKIQ